RPRGGAYILSGEASSEVFWPLRPSASAERANHRCVEGEKTPSGRGERREPPRGFAQQLDVAQRAGVCRELTASHQLAHRAQIVTLDARGHQLHALRQLDPRELHSTALPIESNALLGNRYDGQSRILLFQLR